MATGTRQVTQMWVPKHSEFWGLWKIEGGGYCGSPVMNKDAMPSSAYKTMKISVSSVTSSHVE